MNGMQKRGLVLFVLSVVMLAGGAFLRATADPDGDPQRYAERIPVQLETWRLVDQWEPTADEIAILGTSDIIHRSYTRPDGRTCYLSVVRSENKRTGVHDPLTCFRGQGWETMRKQPVTLTVEGGPTIPAMELVIAKGGAEKLGVFFFKTGPYYSNDFLRQQVQVVWTQLFHEASNSSLLRMETDLGREPVERSRERLYSFIEEVLPEIVKHVP